MRFFTAVSVFGLFTSAIGTPVAAPAAAVEKRQYSAQVSLLSGLYNNIQAYTGTINSTVLGLPADADDASKAAAAATVNNAVSRITGLINDASANVGTATMLAVRPRQADTASVVDFLGLILLELSGSLNNVISVLGLGSLLGLGGLTGALGQLVAALKVVVDDLLIVVKQLLDGILIGLSLALAGFTF